METSVQPGIKQPDHADYRRIEVVIEAVHIENVEVLRQALEALCWQYREADTLITTGPVEAGTTLHPPRAPWLPPISTEARAAWVAEHA